MPNQKNIAQHQSLTEKVTKAKSILIADYSGLNVAAQSKLRAQVVQAGGEVVVAKNRIFKIAVADSLTEGESTLDDALNGPNAMLFSYEDAVAALKAAFDFAKDNENLEIKVSILDGKVLDHAATENLSKLPSKDQLIAQLISRINGPAYGLVSVLNGPARGLVQVLKAIHDQKSAN